MLTLSFNGSDSRVLAWLASSQSEIVQVLRVEMLKQMIRLQNVVVEDKLSGEVLGTKTGTLRRAQHASVTSDGSTIAGTVATDPTASSYGFVHEYGGTFDVSAYLRKSSQNHDTWVRAHSVTFPERSFLRSSLAEMAPEIVAGLQEALDVYVREKNLE